ncbi:MAG: PRC-barrel domain-containing protein [Candidatus Aenigmarchaeota archaeon]|nr:PRC-barrel domain-containing protein [Candidatus Aenigmarchaeota archaeon]
MVVNERTISEVIGRDIFTDKGLYCGKVSDVELDLSRFRIRAMVVDAVKGSYLSTVVSGKRGIIVPYSMLKAVGDIVLIRHITAPTPEDAEMA